MPEPQKVDSRENRILELLHYCEELAAHKVALCRVFEQQLGIPVKVNIDSGGKPNGIPERR